MVRKATSTKKLTPRTASSTRRESSVPPKQQKPVFRAGTVIAVLLLAALVGFAFYLNREKETTAAEATSTKGPANLFAEDEGIISSIEIKPAESEAVKVTRNAENIWALELPEKAEADQSLAEAAATQVTALQVIDSVDADPEIFGLNKPALVITIEFAEGKKHILEVGDTTPTNSGYYVRLDHDKMMIVSLSGIDSLLNLVNFPPYLNTPTPTVLPPTETPVPPTEAISTLEVTVTPTP